MTDQQPNSNVNIGNQADQNPAINQNNIIVQENSDQHQQDFEVDIDNFKVLQDKHQDPKDQVNTNLDVSPERESNLQDPFQSQSNVSPEKEQPSVTNLNNHEEVNQTQNNVQNIEDDGSGFFITGINTHGAETNQQQENNLVHPIEEQPDPVDSYKHIAVVDCSKAFSNQECVLISDKQKSIMYLNSQNQVQFKFDSLVTSHVQVKQICERLVHKFIYPQRKGERDKIVLNFADQFNSNNNAGFNLTNFKVQFINQFFQDVINDYEKSVIGTFTKELLDKLNTDEQCQDRFQLYFTITKFENDIGFSLIHQEPEIDSDQDNQSQNQDTTIPQQDHFNSTDIKPKDQSNNIQPQQDTQPSLNQYTPINQIQNIQKQQLNKETEIQGQITKSEQVKGENQKQLGSPLGAREKHLRNQRKALLTRHGVIPEYIKINEIYQVYTAFTQANLKNSILHQKQARKLAEISEDPIPPYKETELKEDVLVIQFKLVDKQTYKSLNTFNFINLPISKLQDNNVNTLIEILNKSKKMNSLGPYIGNKKKAQNDFIPYRKSILTRVIAEQLQRNNFLVLSHFSKQSIEMHFKSGSGPAKNLFNQIDSLFGDKHGVFQKKKLNDHQALKILQLDQFRDGQKSIEVYTQQAASQMPKTQSIKNQLTPTMFQQILQFLSFKDEIIQGYEEGNPQSLFMRQTPAQDIQKVIFDKNYIKFTRQRQIAQEQEAQQLAGMLPQTVGYRTNGQYTPHGTQNEQINQFQMNRLQFVQYECLKTELKEEYEKRVHFLHKRIEMKQAQQGPYQDAHLILMQNSLGDPRQKRNSERNSNTKYGSLTNFNSPMGDQFFLPGMKNSKTQYDRASANSKTFDTGVNPKRNTYGTKNDHVKQQSQEREQYYKFYLDSAQKAIEMMRKQHKSASIMKMNADPQQNSREQTVFPNNQPGVLPHVQHSQSQYGMYPSKNNSDSHHNFDNMSGGPQPNSLSPLAFAESQNSPQKSGNTTNQGQRAGRILEPIFGGIQNRVNQKKLGSKSGGVSALTQQDENEFDQKNLPSFAQPRMQMIQEDGDGNTALSQPYLQNNKPFSAAHGQRKRTNRDGQSDQRYGAISKQSTQFTGGVAQIHRGALGMSGGISANYEQHIMKPPRQRVSSIPGMSRSTQKNFQPLRHMGRLGHVGFSNERQTVGQNIENIGLIHDTNYKSAGEFNNQNFRDGLYKSKSQAKQLKPVSKKEPKRSNILNPIIA